MSRESCVNALAPWLREAAASSLRTRAGLRLWRAQNPLLSQLALEPLTGVRICHESNYSSTARNAPFRIWKPKAAGTLPERKRLPPPDPVPLGPMSDQHDTFGGRSSIKTISNQRQHQSPGVGAIARLLTSSWPKVFGVVVPVTHGPTW